MGIQHACRISCFSAALVVSLLALCGPGSASAQELHSFSVQDKDAADALRALGAQAGIQILASAEDLAGIKLNAVVGSMSTAQALQSLLAGTGLEYRYVSDVAVAVVPSAPARRVRVSTAVDASATAAEATPAPQGSASTEAAPSGGAAGQLQEIIVTATRRAEDISKVPISITAVTQTSIDTLGIKDFSDMAKYTPGVVIDTDRTNQISIRGISSSSGSADTTGIYIDDTPVQSRSDIDPLPEAFDVERIEVLRGPQGTLFGAGAEGGAVRYITVQPSTTKSDIYSRDEVSYTQNGAVNWELGLAGGGPVIDNVLGFRATALVTHQGGWVNRVDSESASMMAASANPNADLVSAASQNVLDSNANRFTQKLLRVAMLWEPTQNWQITPSIYYQTKSQNDEDVYWASFSDPSRDIYNNGNPERVPTVDHFYLYGLKIQGNLGFADFVSNSSYFDRYTASSYNGVTGTTYNLGFFQDLVQGYLAPNAANWIPGLPWINGRGIVLSNPTTGALLPHSYYAPAPTWAWFYNYTQEFRLQSRDTASKFQWTTGVFYELDQQIDQNYIYAHYDRSLFGLFGLTVPDIFGGEDLEVTNNPSAQTNSWDVWQNQYTRQYAVFADGAYAFTDQWKLDVGLRESWIIYTFDESTSGSQEFGPSLLAYGYNKEPSFTPKASLNFQMDPNDLLYFTYAKGFRPGGANSPISYASCASDFQHLGLTTTPLSYKSDTTQSYEIGAKNNIANTVQLATSIYYIRWNDIQQFALLPVCGIGFLANLGQAVSKGFDIQGDFRLTDNFTVNLAVGYNEARYTANSKITPTAPTNVVESGDAINGANGEPVPPWTGTLGLEYRFNAFTHQGFIRADDQFTSAPKWLSAQFDPNTTLYDPRNFLLPSLNQLNLRTGLMLGIWEVDAFVNNLLDSHSMTTYGLTVPGYVPETGLISAAAQRPRTMGLTFIFRK